MSTTDPTDGRRLRGDASRRAVLAVALDRASVHGLAGLTIGGVAGAAGMSKGGVTALFGTKEQLQLATVAAAREVLAAEVVGPAHDLRGRARLEALVEGWIAYSGGRRFPGGCFFARTEPEWAGVPGPVRDAVDAATTVWTRLLADAVREARDAGEVAGGTDPEQAAFEVTALLDRANTRSLLEGSGAPYDAARRGVDRLLAGPSATAGR